MGSRKPVALPRPLHSLEVAASEEVKRLAVEGDVDEGEVLLSVSSKRVGVLRPDKREVPLCQELPLTVYEVDDGASLDPEDLCEVVIVGMHRVSRREPDASDVIGDAGPEVVA